jgi:cytochrome c oxidase assembly factor CtaG
MANHYVTTGMWQLALPLTVILAFLGLVYLRGWLQLRSVANRVSLSRAFGFLLGLFFIWVAAASPLSRLDHELLTVHMIQHLLLMALAPPLIWLGEPLRVLSSGLPQGFVNAVQREIRLSAMEHFGKAISRPAVCLVAASAALVGWHIPAAFALGMSSASWHAVQQATFLGTGLLFWWPVVQPWPAIAKPEMAIILYLFFATLPCDILSGFLVFCDRVVYPLYLSSNRLFGFSALGDQQCAGALMWTCVTILYLVTAALFTMRLLSPSAGDHPVLSDRGVGATSTLIQSGVEVL